MGTEEEMYLVYETLLKAYEEVSNDPGLEQFQESASRDLAEFQENYPEVVAEYNFLHRNVQ